MGTLPKEGKYTTVSSLFGPTLGSRSVAMATTHRPMGRRNVSNITQTTPRNITNAPGADWPLPDLAENARRHNGASAKEKVKSDKIFHYYGNHSNIR